MKPTIYEKMNKAVFQQFLDLQVQNILVNGAVLQQRARDFAGLLDYNDFQARAGWLC